MSRALNGFEDLKPRDVLSFNADGTATVIVGDKVERYQIQIQPTGSFSVREIEVQTPDQTQERQKVSVAQRWAMTDQGQAAMQRGDI